MSLRTFASRTFASRTFNARTFNGSDVTITNPAQAGWIARTAGRLSVPREAGRVAISSPQQRVWIVRSDNG
jgi:hypothetical protein